MTNKWEYSKSIGAGIILLAILSSPLYMDDYRGILKENPDQDMIVLNKSDELEILGRTNSDNPEFLRWKYDNAHTTMYHGYYIAGDSWFKLKCYYDLNNKTGYRDISWKNVGAPEYEYQQDCEQRGYEVSAEGDRNPTYNCNSDGLKITENYTYFRDSYHTHKIGEIEKTTYQYPMYSKINVDFTPTDKDMPCQLVWIVDDVDSNKDIDFKASDWPIEDSTYRKSYDDGLALDWSLNKSTVSWARQYSTSRVYVAFNSQEGQQEATVEFETEINNTIIGDTVYYAGEPMFNQSELNVNCMDKGSKIVCDSTTDGNGDGKVKPGESYLIIDGSRIETGGYKEGNYKTAIQGVK